jgi:hypothetical protein
VKYVGGLLHEPRDVQLTLFHVLKPLPANIGTWGIGNSKCGRGPQQTLADGAGRMGKAESAVECPILLKALEAVVNTGFPIFRVTLKFGHKDDVGRNP